MGLGARLLSLVGNVALKVSAWNGATLVYRHGIGVGEERPIVPFDMVEEPAKVA